MIKIFLETLDNRILAEADLGDAHDELLIGRSGACDILLDKPAISRRHLAIRLTEGGGIQICDLHSTLGTTVDDVRLPPNEWQTPAPEQKIILGRQIVLRLERGKPSEEFAAKADSSGVFPFFLVRNERRIKEYFNAFASQIQDHQQPAFETFQQQILSCVMELAATVEVSVALGNIDDYHRLLNFAIDMALKVTKAQRGAIVLINEHTQKLETVTHRSMNPNEVTQEMNTSKSVLLKCLKQNRILIIQDTASDQDLSSNRSIYLYKIKSVAVAPLRFERKLLGLLYLDTQGVACQFPERIEEILKVLAAQISLAINNAKLFHQATKDLLTGIDNRRFLLQRYKEEIARSIRQKQTLSLVLLDIDHFKKVNDTHGHDVGDLVLECVAKHLKNNVRIHDLVARFGGEEFILLLTNTDSEGAVVLAEKLRTIIESVQMRIAGDICLTLTVSMGIATATPEEIAALSSPNRLIKQADLALYRAKESGRNQVQVYTTNLEP